MPPSRALVLGLFSLIAGLAAACGGGSAQTGGTTGGAGGSKGTTTSSSTGGSGGTSGDGALGMPSDHYPAPFPAPPQVQDFGGPVLASPKIVPVFFAGDDAATMGQIVDFVDEVGAGSYWTAAVSEYGVGPATGEAPILLTETAPANIDDTAIQTWLAGKLDGDDPAWPAPDANTVYALHYPAGTNITLALGPGPEAMSCNDFGGYHSNITLDGNHGSADVAYAVLPRCPAVPGTTVIQGLTESESHELIEASTDPYPITDPAYGDVDSAHAYWNLALGGGEIGDMCAQFSGVFTQFPGLDYVVQRVWSNKAARAGDDPCVPPLAGEVYFNAAPELNDDATISYFGENVTVKSVAIPVGKSKTIDLDLFSDASTGGPFSVHVDDGQVINGGSALLSFSVGDTPTIPCPSGTPAGSVCVGGENGQKIPLTITVMSAGSGNMESFWVVSALPGDVNESFWIGVVTSE
jgi:hypothetical protein